MGRYLSPLNPYSFKLIFGTEKNQKILIHFLNDILGFTEENTIQEVEFLGTIMNPEIASDRQSIVDILCKDSIGRRFVVEMQVARDKGFEKRAQLYAAKAYSRQSCKYFDLQKVYFIAISNCNLFPQDVYYISTHNIRDIKTNGHYLKDFQFVFVELPKFPKSKVDQLETTIERWCFFFRYAAETTDEDLKKIAEQEPIIKLAYDELDKSRWKEKDLVAYEERDMNVEKEEAILEQRLDDATEKGKKEGREEGREEGIQIGEERGIQIGEERGKVEVAKTMLADNVDVNTIAKFTGLSPDEIEKLQEKITL
ncbi:Rpn family recombination-promoting nuclease/putative transposase [Wolbachia endosymbiont of Ctenocephalides felis wCfeT]|uniref:Rpn family recombination-promoting nuclease/putative transposase n=1 Tax=Wolbachia endosymbiont of Ctenocephalides felis wCfeT TaxID=2732593 RepID=UPI001447B2D0|nr:Rpn family recombination-promoting nuclease/putative transposase [Wolbachia endosymbiont of Ctenocephalides felis wCfeT]